MITELIKGKTLEEATRISNRAVADALDGLPPRKMHCSVLAEEALTAALKDYFEKAGDREAAGRLTGTGEETGGTSPPCCEGEDNPCCGSENR
jgi:hypothetical protein